MLEKNNSSHIDGILLTAPLIKSSNLYSKMYNSFNKTTALKNTLIEICTFKVVHSCHNCNWLDTMTKLFTEFRENSSKMLPLLARSTLDRV